MSKLTSRSAETVKELWRSLGRKTYVVEASWYSCSVMETLKFEGLLSDSMQIPKTIPEELREMISGNSELGTKLLSLLLMNNGSAQEIATAVQVRDSSLQAAGVSRSRVPRDALDGPAVLPAALPQEDEDLLRQQLEKRRKNTEASARFRLRRKQREREKILKLEQLHDQVNKLYVRINDLTKENDYWKNQLKEVNERKSRRLLDSIKNQVSDTARDMSPWTPVDFCHKLSSR